ncbi:MAG: hypothetical protein M3P51_06485 [Chloroflexota bacterium]|nr:hypothetical protein [Chloroflexota bacterium]
MREPDWPGPGWTFRPPPGPRMDLLRVVRIAQQAAFDGGILAIPYLEIYRDAFRLTVEVWSDDVVRVQSPVLVADQSGKLYDVGQEGGFGTVGVRATHVTSYEPLRPSAKVLAVQVPLERIDEQRETTNQAMPVPPPFGRFQFAIPLSLHAS